MRARVKLQKLLTVHNENLGANSLVNSLGDGYLLSHSHIFRNIRQEFAKFGYTLTTEDFCHYAVMPYLSLPKILDEKRVPYFDNVTVLEDLERRHPGRFYCDEILMVRPNHCLHESSHCIADVVLKSLICESNFLSAEQNLVLKLILAEAFANSVESLANLSNRSILQKLFFDLNSYVTHDGPTETLFQKAKDLLGLENLSALVYVSYIFSNCLQPKIHQKNFLPLVELLIADSALAKKASESAAVHKVFNHAMDLSVEFRLQTTGFYCSLMGAKTDVRKLLSFDVANLLGKTSVIQDFIDSTLQIFRTD